LLAGNPTSLAIGSHHQELTLSSLRSAVTGLGDLHAVGIDLAARMVRAAGRFFYLPQSLRLAGSSSSSRTRVIVSRPRMISISFLRTLGGPIMIAPTSRSS
jgi:hypothetical protein